MKPSLITRVVNKKTSRALSDYKMIAKGDRVLVGVSGIDSLSLLRVLRERLHFSAVKYHLIAVHINLNKANAEVIEKYLKTTDIEHHIIKGDLKKGRIERNTSECFWCSWKRREAIFKLSQSLRCRKIVFAHHLDDVIETYLLNIFFQGESSTMPPKLKMFDGAFHLIRPFIYLEKKTIKEYASFHKIPPMPYKCPHGKITNRVRMREIIASLAKDRAQLKKNIYKSMSNVNRPYLPSKDM